MNRLYKIIYVPIDVKTWVGITLFPFIFIESKHKGNLRLINHEKIHIKQQIELLVIPFYIIYFLNLVYNLIKYRNYMIAYKNVIFEREAYYNDRILNYLEYRKPYSFLKFLK